MSTVRWMAAAVALAATGCGSLSSDVSQWTIDVAPVDGGRIAFCPAILDTVDINGTVDPGYDGSFAAPENVVTAVSNTNDDVYTFYSAGSIVGGPVPTTLAQLMNTAMTFDMGPIGTVYDNNDPVTVPYAGVHAQSDPNAAAVTLRRTLVGGARLNDTKVELKYAYEPSCTTLKVVDSTGAERSCTCEPTTLTFTFTGT